MRSKEQKPEPEARDVSGVDADLYFAVVDGLLELVRELIAISKVETRRPNERGDWAMKLLHAAKTMQDCSEMLLDAAVRISEASAKDERKQFPQRWMTYEKSEALTEKDKQEARNS